MTASMWTFQGWNKEQHEKITRAVQDNHLEVALGLLDTFGIYNAFASCVDLAEKNRAGFEALAARAAGGSGKSWADFYLRLVKEGAVPAGIASMTDGLYHSARMLLLRAREDNRIKKLGAHFWPRSEDVARSRPFYPERLRKYPKRRDRVCQLCKDHEGLEPLSDEETALFSLGGLYTYTWARSGTNPQKPATTCILFVRSILQAAGCNVINDNTSKFICSCPGGTDVELPTSRVKKDNPFGYVNASAYDQGLRPLAGDIFHIKGDNFRDPAGNLTTTNSDHIGIIVEVVGKNQWRTIEGGGPDNITLWHTRKLVEVKSPHGNWAFDDDKTTAGVRPLQGWYNLDNVKPWMKGA
jgi:hypothetical protein